jgi:hypothetical protein
MYNFLLKRKIKKALNSFQREKAFLNLKKVKTVLILFDTADYGETIHFVNQLRHMGKKVKMIAYKDKNDMGDYPKINKIVSTKEMKDWLGELLAPVIDFVEKGKSDLVIDFNFKKNLLLQYILAKVNSPFRVGFYRADFQLHDMIILYPAESDSASTVKELSRQLVFYLTTISSAEAESL